MPFTFCALCNLARSAMVRHQDVDSLVNLRSQFQLRGSPMRDKGMSKVCLIVTVCVVLAVGVSAVAQQAAGNGAPVCSNQTLYGDYGILIEGTILDPNWTVRTLAMAHFDGKGAFRYVDYAVINGTPRSPDWSSNTGTYAVNRDCTATALFGGVIPVHLVVVNSGKDLRGVTDGDAITLVGSRVH